MSKKSFLENIAGYILLAAAGVFFIVIWNPFQLAIYSLFTGAVIFLIFYIRQPEKQPLSKHHLRRYLFYTGVTYFLVVVLYSLSPYLRLKEFQWTHPGYHTVQGEVAVSGYGVYKQRSNLYGFVNVDYSYQVNGHRYQQHQKEVLKFYSFPIFSNTKTEYLSGQVARRFSRLQQQESYVIMVNDRQPDRSRFFSSAEAFYWSGSALKNFLAGILFMIIIFAMIGLFAFLFRNYKTGKS
ncbi:hypothetical protein [Chitinophaga sp.]|uniref:hypothetical protein n=1 Tax=Chitinophaga sp. TaxID=1869181 RepID=UPI002F937BB2